MTENSPELLKRNKPTSFSPFRLRATVEFQHLSHFPLRLGDCFRTLRLLFGVIVAEHSPDTPTIRAGRIKPSLCPAAHFCADEISAEPQSETRRRPEYGGAAVAHGHSVTPLEKSLCSGESRKKAPRGGTRPRTK